MDASTQQQEMKKCPACAELILADAKKCKHCGERLDRPSRQGFRSFSPEKRKKVVVAGAVVLAVAVFGGLGWLAYSRVPETKLWVSMHKDVEWHRGWQDARTDGDRTRVADLYRELSGTNPEDGNLKYLALRALPDGKKQLDEFRDAAKKFDKNPWVLYGLAAAEEDNGDLTEAGDLRVKAIELFGQDVPDAVLGFTAVGFARNDDIDRLKSLYVKNRDRIRGSRGESMFMAQAAFLRGDFDGMVKWEEHAESLGSKNTVFRTIKQRAEAIGLRPDLIGTMRTAPGVMDCKVVEYTAKPVNDGTEFVLRLKMTSNVWREDLHVWLGNAAIVPTSGSKIESSSNWSTDIPPGKDIEVGVPFFIPAGKTVEKFVFDTGRVRRPWNTPILVTIVLKADGSFKVEDPIRPDSIPTLSSAAPAPTPQPTATATPSTK